MKSVHFMCHHSSDIFITNLFAVQSKSSVSMNPAKPGRNDPCPCGSGKKYKQCCMQRDIGQAAKDQTLELQIQQALRQAWTLQSMRRNAEAEAICKQVFAVRPNHPEALHLLGVMALSDGNIAPAIAALSKAVALQAQHPQYHANLGLAYHESGQLEMAVKHYQQALKRKPDHVDAYYNLHAVQLGTQGVDAAIGSLEHVLSIAPRDLDARFMLGMLLEYRGRPDDLSAAQRHFERLDHTQEIYAARLDAWRYLKSACKKLPPVTGSNLDTFKLAMAAARTEGLVLEFGVRHGNTIRQIARLAGQEVHGFDSFEGLPEEWHHEPKGSYTTKGHKPQVPSQVQLHAGWFEDTLPEFLAHHAGNVRLVNIDCDIYSSTRTVLEALAPRIVRGSVLVFDEYIGNAHWREDEFKAFQEAVKQYGWRYEYLSFSFFTKQVVVLIK